ncbi:uncharacterized protein METZ01_LOCUS165012, partial [marine metagenome]
MSDNFRVAIDALGGDNAPAAPVEGAVLAARNDGAEVLLVGNSNIVKAELDRHDIKGLPISVISSEGKVEDDEAPALALRQKPKAS